MSNIHEEGNVNILLKNICRRKIPKVFMLGYLSYQIDFLCKHAIFI